MQALAFHSPGLMQSRLRQSHADTADGTDSRCAAAKSSASIRQISAIRVLVRTLHQPCFHSHASFSCVVIQIWPQLVTVHTAPTEARVSVTLSVAKRPGDMTGLPDRDAALRLAAPLSVTTPVTPSVNTYPTKRI